MANLANPFVHTFVFNDIWNMNTYIPIRIRIGLEMVPLIPFKKKHSTKLQWSNRYKHRGVSSVPFPFQLHCELVSSLLALDATELVSQPLTQMVVEMINIHVISVQQKR